MLMLVAGVILVFVPHSVSIVAPHWRDRMVLLVGEARWKSVYSVLVAAGFALVILGFIAAYRAPIVLYLPPAWMRYVTFVLMLPVFPLLFATYLPGRILARAKHPMLAAVMLWSTAHLFANGTLPGVLLCACFLAWALIDRLSLGRRVPAPIRRAPPRRYNDALAVILGLALYALFIWRLHGWIIGVPLLAR
ncbi:MAG: NnrU family protein [Steroidobacteraceae bacterium]